MKIQLIIFLNLCAIILYCHGLRNYLAHSQYECVKCLCHARTGCWQRKNCADYSISFDYWKKAGRLALNPHGDLNEQVCYRKCMNNENCIVGTIIEYTQKFGKIDCNCDGNFDCKDRLAIHLHGENCKNPKYGDINARWFNECASGLNVPYMSASENGCLPGAN